MEEIQPLKILYIDDDPDMINLVSIILNRPEFCVKTAQSGRAGLDLALEDPPDLILLDLMMPDMDGWAVYQQIKTHPDMHATPVIVVTAKSQPIDRVLGLRIAKVDGYLCKPFRPQGLIDTIAQVTGRSFK